MTGYELTSQWFSYVDENPEWVDTNVTALYFAILQRSNELRWKVKFQLPALDTMQRIGIRSPKTYYPALDKLVKAGFVTILEQAKNQFTACIIQINAEVNITPASTPAWCQQVPQHGVSTDGSTDGGKGNKDKQENKTNKETEPADSFELFWNAYDKKEDRKKCLDKWLRLPEPTRRKIIEHVPVYICNKPDPTYRKNPLTYLNGEIWKDPLQSSANVIPLNGHLKKMVV